ncbi:MAG TPA: VOC family protein [Bryobacteraceae bacterium]|jgi:catechol 2,3-dioxygenase-like lactoylglutathione lyase family enzyme
MIREIGRREMLGALGIGALMRVAHAADDAPRYSMLDHLEFFVSDVEKSTAFYAQVFGSRLFGNPVMKNNRTTRRYVRLGTGYMAIDSGPQLRVDHICAGVAGFQVASMHSFLEQRGVAYRDYPSGKDLSIGDPDGGVRLQLAADKGWDALAGGTASPESVRVEGNAVFRPLGLDHILLNVPDPEKSATFYEKVLGPVAQRNDNRIWFQVGRSSRIGLLKTPEGQKAGVNHFCVASAGFDYGAAAQKLVQVGAKVEMPELAGAPEFRDPDGYLIQVIARAEITDH